MAKGFRKCSGGLLLLTAASFSTLLFSCSHVNEGPINIAVVKDGKEFLLEGKKADKWKVNSFLIKDYCHGGEHRDVNLTFDVEDTTAALNVLYAAQERFETERTFRVATKGRVVKFKRYLIDDPLIPSFNCYVVQIDSKGHVIRNMYYLNEQSMARWHIWWEEHNYVVYESSRMPEPDRSDCVVTSLSKDFRPEHSIDKKDVSVLLIAEGDTHLHRVVDVVAEFSERFGCDVYLMCRTYEFNEWLKAEFPERL